MSISKDKEIQVSPPLWLEGHAPSYPRLEGEISCDVAIVGGGMTGVGVAYWLQTLGKELSPKVVLLERDSISYGATGRNAGFILLGTAEHYERAVNIYGRREAKDLWVLTKENHTLMKEVIEKHRLACEYRQGGSLHLAASQEEQKELIRSARLLEEDGFPCSLLEKKEADALLGGQDFFGALLTPQDGEINPARFITELARVTSSLGAAFYEGTPVEIPPPDYSLRQSSSSSSPGELLLATPGGRVRAEVVVLAINGYSSLLHPFFQGRITPVRGQMLATAPLGKRLFPYPIYANYGFEYWRQLEDGRIIIGGKRESSFETEVGSEEVPTAAIQEGLEAFLHHHFPSLEFAVTHRWAGTMGFTPDGFPLVGTLPGDPRLFVTGGYSGHGLGLAFKASRIMAEALLEGKPAPARFSPRRFLEG